MNSCSDAPLIGSNPHFYNGDSRYIYGIYGMNPDKNKHETHILVEKVGKINYYFYYYNWNSPTNKKQFSFQIKSNEEDECNFIRGKASASEH